MRKSILFRTNILVCIIIILGFAITSIISYRSNLSIYEKDVEYVSDLTSEGIYHQIDSIFAKPVNVSLTMANDSLLKEFLSNEAQRLSEDTFIEGMRDYLLAYREKYSYDSVFLVSTQTNRYYHFNGIDRVLGPDNPENEWYYDFLESDEEYSLQIDNDEAANDEITVFVNCKIKDRNGTTMGVVGVGFRVDYLQELLKEYEVRFGVSAHLIDEDGFVQVATDHTGYEKIDLFDICSYPELKSEIIDNKTKTQNYWYSSSFGKGYVVTRYVPTLKWHLIVENDTTTLNRQLSLQLTKGVAVIIVNIALVLFTITSVMRKYNAQIIRLTVSREKEYRTIFQEATEQLYENIYEWNITHNCASGESTEQYFKSLGIPANTPYDEALKEIAKKQIKEEYQQGYLDTFTSSNVLKVYQGEINSLIYDVMITNDGSNYYWMRIIARIFYWDEDNTVRMFTYRQNIDEDKRHEKKMFEQIQRDSLSGLYNKAATQERVHQILHADPDQLYAFYILDIDNFKQVNDRYGHAVGDKVIAEFARILKGQFCDRDIVGRIGGDEFVVFLLVPNREWAIDKAQELVSILHKDLATDGEICTISTSIGIALAPETGKTFETLYKRADYALYQTKERGENGYTLYRDTERAKGCENN